MINLYSKILFFACASMALLCSCGEIEIASQDDGFSQKCASSPSINSFQKNFGGYKKGKSIPFKHSDGYLFSLAVTDWDNYMDEHSCQAKLDILLESAYPIYSIPLSTTAPTFYYDESHKSYSGVFEVQFGQYLFYLDNPLPHKQAIAQKDLDGKDTIFYGPDSLYIGKMEINGVTYDDVLVSHGRKYEPSYDIHVMDKVVLSDAKLYYQEKKGILKIELEDGSHIAINEKEK